MLLFMLEMENVKTLLLTAVSRFFMLDFLTCFSLFSTFGICNKFIHILIIRLLIDGKYIQKRKCSHIIITLGSYLHGVDNHTHVYYYRYSFQRYFGSNKQKPP